jgi:hypothetical protein
MSDEEALKEIEEHRVKQVMLAITKAMNGIAEVEDWALICQQCNLQFIPMVTH